MLTWSRVCAYRWGCRGYSSLTDSVPVITVPHYLEKNWRKHVKRVNEKTKKDKTERSRIGNKSIPVITCKDRSLNHYLGQTYDAFKPLPLASHGWRRGKYKSDYFTIEKYESNPAVVDEPQVGFGDLGVSAGVEKACPHKTPTVIQIKAIPRILQGANTVVAAETGSGKTVAFTLPLLDKVLQTKRLLTDTIPNAPLALIITPGRELTRQISDVITDIGAPLGVSVSTLIGGKTKKRMLNPSVRQMDVLVASFGSLSKLTTVRHFDLNRVRTVVVDEADTMLDDSFNDHLLHYLQKFGFHETLPEEFDGTVGAQLVLCGATIPTRISSILNKIIPPDSLETISTTTVNAIVPHVPQKFVRIGMEDKEEYVLELIKSNLERSKRTLIFTNESKCCHWLYETLARNDVAAVRLMGGMSYHERKDQYAAFHRKDVDVMVSTDLGSRGLDTCSVHHVINFDAPRFMSDYIHRVGRVGRVGGEEEVGVTTLVARLREVQLVQEIETAVRKNACARNVDANIKGILNRRAARAVGVKELPAHYVME